MIYLAMQDKIHQPYRKGLIPGLSETLQSMNPSTQPGLLGICLSGAGPTILALATTNFEEIAEIIIGRFKSRGISCEWKLLEPAQDGATVERL
jgi:homoserine kinase